MDIEVKYSSLLLGNLRKPRTVATTQSTVGIDINNNNNNSNSSLPIGTYNYNNISTTGDNNTNNNSNSNTNNSSNSIGYVAWDFAGQLEYSTLHPVTSKTIYHVSFLPYHWSIYLFF